MPDENVIKDYLIGLGFKVDTASLNKMKESLKQVGREVKDTSAKISSDSRWAATGFSQAATGFTTAAKAIAAAFASVTIATVKLFDKTSQADLGYQKFALKMYMAKGAAKEFKIVTDAMGESFEDIAWIPELTQRYRALMMDARKMALPEDADAQFKYLRSIRHEFDRLKVEATYGMQWVGMALFKHLQEPITKIKEGAVKLNDYIIQNMPEISEKIADWISKVLIKGYEFGVFIKDLFGDLKGLHGKFPEWAKAWGIWETAIAAVFVIGGPVTKAFVAIGLAAKAMESLYSYLDGSKGEVESPFWKGLMENLYDFRRAIQVVIISWEYLKELLGFSLDKKTKDWVPGEEEAKEGIKFRETAKGEWVSVDNAATLKAMAEKHRQTAEKTISDLWGKTEASTIKSINQRMREWDEEDLRAFGSREKKMKSLIREEIPSMRRYRGDYEYEAFHPGKETILGGMISKAAKKYKADEATIKAIVQMESSSQLYPKVGAAGEVGPMQLMRVHTKGMKDPTDPEENIMVGTAFYKKMRDKYKEEAKAIAAYHIGETKMDKYGGGIPSYAEKYVEDVLRFKEQITNNNNITINITGQTNEELVSKVEEVVRRAAVGDTVRIIRTAGVAP
uniref:Putative transglycosylase n=1 Tax=viral metagenome TaxID=1070528 RepID=A0A6M3MCU5_9ZZZZ